MARFIFTLKRILILIFIFIFLINLSTCHSPLLKKEYFGEFYANDCGQSHGGFEWAGEYTASLIIQGNKGELNLTFSGGLGDLLTRHKFSVNEFVEAGGNMSFKIDGRKIILFFVEKDQIWNGKYNNYYMGNSSNDFSEQIGWVSVEIFKGLKPHYYVELRLRSSGPGSSKLIFR